MEGKELIKDLQMKYGDQIEILAGSGINACNALELMNYTGITQVHSSCKDWVNDPTTQCYDVTFGYAAVSYTHLDVYKRQAFLYMFVVL